MTATTISQGCLQDLYLQKQLYKKDPVVQILAFQVSEYNPKQIILRISDRESFLDCLLVGPYIISQSKIVSSEYTHNTQSYKRYDIVRITDYFCKIDPSKICQLKIIIRKLDQVMAGNMILGKPQQISQLIEDKQLGYTKATATVYDNSKLINAGTVDTPIKLEEIGEESYCVNQNIQKKTGNENVNVQKDSQNQEEPLCLQDIMNNKQGFFIGRLVRFKFGCKQAKDGPMSFLYLGFVDRNGEMVRIHLAGRVALRQSRQLKKGKCYLIKGIELFQGEKIKGGSQIRLHQKSYQIHQITNENVKAKYKSTYYCWEHEHDMIQSQMVDVIGYVEEIEDTITYKNVNTFQEQRDVKRLIIKNAFKTVKISFWADHINILNNLNLQRKQAIIIEDIKKKKTIFLDFITQSNIIILDDFPELKEEFQAMLPPLQQAPQPNNIKELIEVFQLQPFSAKHRVLNLVIAGINPKWIIYKMCNNCKKKVERILQSCQDCQKSDFCFRYNCPTQLSDSSGSINCVAFDAVCQKLFGRSANSFSQLTQSQIKELLQNICLVQYKISIESKNNRSIIRSIDLLTNIQIVAASANNIQAIRQQSQVMEEQI